MSPVNNLVSGISITKSTMEWLELCHSLDIASNSNRSVTDNICCTKNEKN